MDWATLYPAYAKRQKQEMGEAQDDAKEKVDEERETKAVTKNVEIADIGCGFGGLLFALAPMFPDTLMLGKSTSKKGTIVSDFAKPEAAHFTIRTHVSDLKILT
jgi:tRNA G46 methylase TrmB